MTMAATKALSDRLTEIAVSVENDPRFRLHQGNFVAAVNQ
jgi:hypothetical protein